MTRATLRQRLFGLSKRDLAKLKQTEETAFAIAVKAAGEHFILWRSKTPKAYPIVYKGRVAWFVEDERNCEFIGIPTRIFVDDATGEILRVVQHIR